VTITNRTDATRSLSWFEYWDVNPYVQNVAFTRGVAVPIWDPTTRTLSAAQSGGVPEDVAPLDVFAAVLTGPADGFETSVATFFGGGSRAAPAAVVADALSNGLAPASMPGSPSGTLFAFRAALTLAPGESTTLRYAFGAAHGDQIAGLVAKYRDAVAPFVASQAAWASWVPKADFGAGNEWVARELQWDAYLLRSASVYEELCGNHTITQGGYYQYSTGLNLGTRSWPHYLLPMVYTEPALARELLRYTIGVQSESGDLPYGMGPLCNRADLGTSGDLDFWIFLAAVEYGLGARDLAFFDARSRSSTRARRRASGPREARVRASGELARTERRVSRRHERRLVRLQHRLPSDERVAARERAARVRLSALGGAGGSSGRSHVRAHRPEARRGAPSCRAHTLDGEGLVCARVEGGRHRDRIGRHLRRAAAMGDPRRHPDAEEGEDARREPSPLPRRRRCARRRERPVEDRLVAEPRQQ
jgi:hypothetical protein